jgi:hypothetical protein
MAKPASRPQTSGERSVDYRFKLAGVRAAVIRCRKSRAGGHREAKRNKGTSLCPAAIVECAADNVAADPRYITEGVMRWWKRHYFGGKDIKLFKRQPNPTHSLRLTLALLAPRLAVFCFFR